MSRDDERSAALCEIALAATELQRDLIPLAHRVARERRRFGDEEIELEEISFWYKCLIHEALCFVDGLCHTMRVVLGRFAGDLETELTAKQLAVVRDSTLRQPLRRVAPLTFRALPKLFGATFELDTGGTNYRAFLALADARERFTHPKEPKDIHPFAALATMNFALEWIFFSWRDLLLACAAGLREGVDQVPSLPERGQPFDEQRLAGFEKAEGEYDAAHASDSFTAKLSAMIFGLMDDSGRALDLANARDEVGDASTNFRLRNLVRFLYTEIEGTVFVAASYLFEHGFAGDKPTKALLTGSHEVVRGRIVKVLEDFARHFGNDFEVPREGKGWEAFCDFREMRDRLVHPKDASDLLIRPEEVGVTLRTLEWWHSEIHGCVSLDGEKLVRLAGRPTRCSSTS